MKTEQEVKEELEAMIKVYKQVESRENKTRVEGFVKGLQWTLGQELQVENI